MILKAPFTLFSLLLGWLAPQIQGLSTQASFFVLCSHSHQLYAPLPHTIHTLCPRFLPSLLWPVAPGRRVFLEPSFKLFRSARQFHTLCRNSTPLPSAAAGFL